MEFGLALKALRAERGWRQEDLVTALGHSFARSTLANVETGRERPSARLWEHIKEHLPEWVPTLEPLFEASRGAPGGPTATRASRVVGDHDHRSAPSHAVGGPFRLESLQFVYTFRYSQVPEEIIEIRRVRALRSGATGYGLQFSATDTSEFVVEEEALWGGALAEKRFLATDHNVHYLRRFDFGRSLRRGQVHEFAVRSWVERDGSPDNQVLFSVTLPTDVAAVHLNFAGPRKPRDVWRFGPVAESDLAPQSVAEGGVPVTPSEDGNVSVLVTRPTPGGHYGVGWEW